MTRSQAGASGVLSFERPVQDMFDRAAMLRAQAASDEFDEATRRKAAADATELEEEAARSLRELYTKLTPWERVQVARHPNRPLSTDLAERIATDLVELHGDRRYGDDPAILTALCRIGRHRCLLVAHRKGKDVKEKVAANFGMAHPEGYRKAMLKMRLAERFGVPVVTLVDTPGAYPGLGAEERGQAWAIAENIQDMIGLRTPIVVAVIGEGGSGGALGIGVGDRMLMMENAYYSVISPEGCAAILWKSNEHAPEAAAQLKITAADLHRLGIVDEIVPEPVGAAHRDPDGAASALQAAIVRALDEFAATPLDALLDRRFEKYRRIAAKLYA
ncbi:MAG: Acetyl-coenzyme A carboxylase carboxyl transferase subunit alpha [Planctomycetes bacterium]|nr:Acetyl-coenzyme A carboxylase carboxyl transferase subunit alpha [Planctomycetota bacterium]